MISISIEPPNQDNLSIQSFINNDNEISKQDIHAHLNIDEDNNNDSDSSISPRFIPYTNSYLNVESEITKNENSDIILCTNTATSSITPSIGDCGICYKKLPLKSNHIFTECGHLFCVKCILNWNNFASTCPFCRKILYTNIM